MEAPRLPGKAAKGRQDRQSWAAKASIGPPQGRIKAAWHTD